jgi:hypothetical protein
MEADKMTSMQDVTPILTIGIIPKQYYQKISSTLKTLLANTDISFNLLIVDSMMPDSYRSQLDTLIRSKPRIRMLRTDRLLQPNEARNLIVAESNDPYICILENDTLIEKNCVEALLSCVQRHEARVIATPLMYDGRIEERVIHHDPTLGHIVKYVRYGSQYYEILPCQDVTSRLKLRDELQIDCMETHMLLFHRNIAERLGPFDTMINTREPVDLSLTAFNASIPIILEPRAVASFTDAQRLHQDDKAFWRHAWNVSRAEESHKHLARKWNMLKLPASMPFVREKYAMLDREIHTLSQQGRLKDDFFRVPVRNEDFAYKKLHKIFCWRRNANKVSVIENQTARQILDMCDGKRSICDIVIDVRSSMTNPNVELVPIVQKALADLTDAGAIRLSN